jgi:hypothetical protein
MTLKGSLALALPLCLVVVFGCGDRKNPNAASTVSGKVTYKDAPVSGGNITFKPEKEGPVYFRPLAADGTYSLTDVPAGNYVVTIETESINPSRKKPTYGRAGVGAPPAEPIPASAVTSAGTYVKIPAKYADVKTSGLKATLGGDKKGQDFPLTD